MKIIVLYHYLHSLPGGTRLAFGVFRGSRLLGALTLGVGPLNAHSLVDGADPDDCLTLTRLWLSDELPPNSESWVLALVLRALRRHTSVKFVLTYADPAQGHLGTIYQATNWLYTGLSAAMPFYDLGDGKLHHSRSLSHAFGTHSVRHFAAHGIHVKLVPQAAKHRYVYFLDPKWRGRLLVPVLPISNGRCRMEVVYLSLTLLREALWNPNRMDKAMRHRLRQCIFRYGLVGVLVVRALADGTYEVLGGNERLRLLRELGWITAPCVVVNLDDAHARLLAQTLNRTHGEDDLGLRAELLQEVCKTLSQDQVLSLIPETAESLTALLSLGQDTIAQQLQAWQQAQEARLRHLQFPLLPSQLEVVEEALAKLLPKARELQGESPNARSTALYLICKAFLEKEWYK